MDRGGKPDRCLAVDIGTHDVAGARHQGRCLSMVAGVDRGGDVPCDPLEYAKYLRVEAEAIVAFDFSSEPSVTQVLEPAPAAAAPRDM